jgi:hypothetical protein
LPPWSRARTLPLATRPPAAAELGRSADNPTKILIGITVMKQNIKKLKEEAAKLSDKDLMTFQIWCADLIEKRDHDKKSDDTKGIHYKDLLAEFRKSMSYSAKYAATWNIGDTAIMFADFYENTRVKGCRPDNDTDMLLVQWGPKSKNEFSFSYTRQVIPPVKGEQEIWQLTLTFTFPGSEELKKVKTGNRWFRNLKQSSELGGFVIGSKTYDLLEELKPSRVSLLYDNVE